MAKDKERAINPAAAQRKLEKQKALKKGKATVAAQRTERLARRNPERLQQQIDSLKAAASSGRPLAARDTKLLADLERDVARVRKARETLGAPQRAATHHTRGPGRGGSNRGGFPGKRRRDGGSGSGSATDDSVRGIPMPRDTPPPLPVPDPRGRDADATLEPLGAGPGGGEGGGRALAARAGGRAQTVYEAEAAVRDLRREAVRRFVPGAVARKLEAGRGRGGVLEVGEREGLERGGYMGSEGGGGGGGVAGVVVEAAPGVVVSPGEVGRRGDGGGGLEEEEDRFERELRELGESTEPRGVEMEEVEDEDL